MAQDDTLNPKRQAICPAVSAPALYLVRTVQKATATAAGPACPDSVQVAEGQASPVPGVPLLSILEVGTGCGRYCLAFLAILLPGGWPLCKIQVVSRAFRLHTMPCSTLPCVGHSIRGCWRVTETHAAWGSSSLVTPSWQALWAPTLAGMIAGFQPQLQPLPCCPAVLHVGGWVPLCTALYDTLIR